MANRNQFKMSIAQRRVRHFSDAIKIQKVREVESGQTKISEIVTEYEVSPTTIYRWMSKFGTMKKKPERLIVEADSDTAKLLELKKKVAELERTIGQKQILIDFKDKMIELAEEHYKIDIKKNFSTQRSSSTGNTGKK
ncbi:MAG: transposase [Cryomorphaceae bacterium]